MCLVCIITAEETRERARSRSGSTEENITCYEITQEINDKDDVDIYYFAIGAMTNITALSLRELYPMSSQPAMLMDYRLVFRGSSGMASCEHMHQQQVCDTDADVYPFDCIHGVLHLMSNEQMKILDRFEGGYIRKPVKVTLYDNTTVVDAYVYKMNDKTWKIPHSLPSERYVDIITKGCVYHNVNSDWIKFLNNHRFIPRKCASDFTSFSYTPSSGNCCSDPPVIPWSVIRTKDGKIKYNSNDDVSDDCSSSSSKEKLWLVINNKVLEFNGDCNSFFPHGYFVLNNIGGTDFTIKFAKGYYEPKYHLTHGMVSYTELQLEHRLWIEDQFCNPPPVLASSKWVMIGVAGEGKHVST